MPKMYSRALVGIGQGEFSIRKEWDYATETWVCHFGSDLWEPIPFYLYQALRQFDDEVRARGTVRVFKADVAVVRKEDKE